MSTQKAAYLDICRRKRAAQQALIPAEWRLKSLPDESVNDVRGIPRECGILTNREIEITETFDAVELAEKIRLRTYSCYEVALAFCKRAAIAQQLLNCLTEIFFEAGLERAKQLDKHLAEHGLPIGPLHGVPVSLKDDKSVIGYDTSCGLASLCFKPAKENTAIVTVLQNAGAVLYCKTNIPQTMMAFDSVNNIWGRTINPLSQKLTPGGSSGGESALVAIRGSLLGIIHAQGSDIGGSIRVPAMCTGTYGVKPTSGRLATNVGPGEFGTPGSGGVGVSVSHGPIATSLRSCELFLKVVADAKLWETETYTIFSPWRNIEPKVRQMRFLVLPTDLVQTPLPPIQRLLKETAAQLQSRGHKVDVMENPPAFLKDNFKHYRMLMGAAGTGGHLVDLIESTGEPMIKPIIGKVRRQDPMNLEQLFERLAVRDTFVMNALKLWKSASGQDYDAIITAVAAHPPPRHDTNVTREDLEAPLGVDTGSAWDKVNRTKNWENNEDYLGIPLALQVVGKKLQEEELLEAMHVVDEAIYGTRGQSLRDHKFSANGSDEVVTDQDIDGDYGSYDNHIFSDPRVAEYWRGVYEKAIYEGRHRFDPKITWSAAEEKRLKRMIDSRVMTWAWLMFFALDVNWRNINRAIADNMPRRNADYSVARHSPTVLSACNVLGSLLAADILQMRGLAGWSGWKFAFLIEGGLTALVGVASWFLMPANPSQTKSWFLRKQGWFTEREEKILVNRLLRDDPSQGDMHNCTPSQFLYGIKLLIVSRVSEWINERSLVSMSSNIWMWPFLLALVLISPDTKEWIRYGLLTGLLLYPYCHAILVAWNSRNSKSVRARAVSAALYNMFVQSGKVISVNIYRENDKPNYYTGNKILLAVASLNAVLFVVVKFRYIKRNQKREEKWAQMTSDERIEYIYNTKDERTKRLNFRFAH
ncbi:Acetamidase [Drechslerella dactyloides]|uniref:Acetamidase n=1 Tax=Drechslerella dactyloides TaxID=74499 RepID=A0AAD6J5E4_DREDA|nr:Acetamidase [Drechslerella dactyloides]